MLGSGDVIHGPCLQAAGSSERTGGSRARGITHVSLASAQGVNQARLLMPSVSAGLGCSHGAVTSLEEGRS